MADVKYMMYVTLELALFSILCQFADATVDFDFLVTPRDQKVVQGSPISLVCKTSLPADIVWSRNGKRVNPSRKRVHSFVSTENTSVLRIHRAESRNNKRYRCRATSRTSEQTIEANASVSVLKPEDIPSGFPAVEGIVGGNTSPVEGETAELVCGFSGFTTPSAGQNVYFWYKDYMLVEAGNDERYVFDDTRGTLEILGVRQSDEGVYDCEIQNEIGNAFVGNVSLRVQPAATTRECLAFNGTSVPHGDSFKPFEDPCVVCQCENGNPSTCLSAWCKPPDCNWVAIKGECCKFNCVAELKAKTCVDFKGNEVQSGQVFHPSRSDPCMSCECRDGQRGMCSTVGCMPPNCEHYTPVEGECCQFECHNQTTSKRKAGTCLDFKGNEVQSGQMFHPSRGDPCMSCECRDGQRGMCSTVSCIPPTCENFTQVEGECCQFECHNQTKTSNRKAGTCLDFKGSEVQSGQMFHPSRSDPCMSCECRDGQRGMCSTVGCMPPNCEHYTQVEGECCQFECHNQTTSRPNIRAPNASTCVDFRGNVVQSGKMYQPSRGNPCKSCECRDGQSGMCMSLECMRPSCRNFTEVEGECCHFQCHNESVAETHCRDSKGNLHQVGETFFPDENDPCESCTCHSRSEMSCEVTSCSAPACPRYETVPGKCCEFICLRDDTRTTRKYSSGGLFHISKGQGIMCYGCSGYHCSDEELFINLRNFDLIRPADDNPCAADASRANLTFFGGIEMMKLGQDYISLAFHNNQAYQSFMDILQSSTAG